ncbi:MAG: RHS repeat protein [Planctomycetes bacterium]|nr:RHS repeat protein [Planctomycetota bacterium]
MKTRHTVLIAIVFVMATATIVFGQEMRWMPIRSAPLGSPVGTVGAPVTPQFNAELGCWEVVVSGGVEVDLDLQASGWGNAPGSPTLGAIQAIVVPGGYNNGVGSTLNPKGWPGSPLDGAYQAQERCEVGGDLSPCSPPFDPTCDGNANGACVHASNWVMPVCAADFAAFVTPTLAYAWAAAAQNDCNTDDGAVKTFGGLILELDANAAGTYVIALDPNPNSSFMFSGTGSLIPGLTFTPACITVITDRTLTEPGGPCTCFGENGECLDDATGETHPVYLFSGEKYESVVDMRIPGRGIDFVWSRKYRSRIGPDTAMGNGWDFSYNIRLEPVGPDLILHNGRTRSDKYTPQPDGTWTRREFLRVIEQNPDGSYTLTHSDTSRWEFQPFDGSPHEGKITASVDRNGNTISFDYDGQGRLVTIHDPLDTALHNRDITIAYNGDGFIESVTDFAGRSVRYTYYGGTEVPKSPALAAAPHDILKNRYISINPRNADLVSFDIRLTLTSTQVNGVPGGQIGSQWWASKPDGKCISIVGPNQPTTPPNWSGCPALHLTGCPIIPTSTYDLVAIFEGNVSDPPLAAATQAKPGVKWHGDCVGSFTGIEWTAPNGTTNIDDAVAAIKTFQDPNAINATHVSVTDMEPNQNGDQINLLVNINDVFSIIRGFQGFEYPGPDIDLCPDTPATPGGPRGNFGDLKSVTTPVVENTAEFPIPAGHDYPDGKTTVYTYSTGFADDRLNHNLLTITDPKGQTYLRNEYYPTTDPSDLNFDRVKRQTWGDPGDVIDIVYVEQTADESNNFATIKAILNDRVGNVKEYFYDAGNRNVITLEYTGRADSDLPTTESDNRPTGKLRPGDPDVFETRYEYNNDSLRTEIVDANGNVVVPSYDEANASRRSQGNMTERCRQPNPLLGGDQADICETFEYDDRFGGCCGSNFITRHVDGRGNETTHMYDDNGNRCHTRHRIPSIVEEFTYNEFGQMTAHTLPDNGAPGGHRRRDEYTYYDGGAQLGYLHQAIVDAPNFALITTYDTFYDPNDNVARVDIQNSDDQGVEQSNTHFTTVFEYEILDYRTKTCQEVGDYAGTLPGSPQVPLCRNLPDSEFLSTEYAYDENRNRTLVRYGEAVEGRDLDNVVETQYDERDLTFLVVRAPGDSDQSTSQYDYDDNRNLIRTSQGIEDVAAPRITTTTYDGYDRLVSTTDPMGNVADYHYDPNSNIGGFQDAAETIRNPFAIRVGGELDDVTGSAGNVRLTESWTQYDEMDRVIRTEVEFFDTDTQTPLQGGQQLGKAITTTEYNDNSRVTRRINDNLHDRTTTYDTANRRQTVTDAKGNTVTSAYDANSNVTSRTEVEKSDLDVCGETFVTCDEIFVTSYAYDNLDRLIQTVDNVGNTNVYAYDSRDNRTFTDDALNHETRFEYDGINRLITTIRDLDDDGADGDGPDITTTQTWDDDSRLIAKIDDNNNAMRYGYDALDRVVAVPGPVERRALAPGAVAGGGTGGHLFPGIAIAQEMQKISPDSSLLFLCTEREFDRTQLEPPRLVPEDFAAAVPVDDQHARRSRGAHTGDESFRHVRRSPR